MLIAIIGGSGFIGTRLSDRLSEVSCDFCILDKVISNKYPEKWRYCDVTKPETLVSSLDNVDIIINLAAEHKDNVHPISLYYDVNVTGARNVCSAADLLKIKHVIFTSSVAVYGFVETETGEDGTFNPFNDYGKSKLEAEYVYDEWVSNDESKTLVTIRPTVVFGENNRGNVYNLFRQIASGRFLMIGNGENKKSMAYVENVAAFLQYSTSLTSGRYVFNYIDKPDSNMNELINVICSALDKKNNNIRVPYFIGIIGGYFFDFLSKILRKEFSVSSIRVKKFCARTQFKSNCIDSHSFTPPVTLSEGIAKTVKNEFGH